MSEQTFQPYPGEDIPHMLNFIDDLPDLEVPPDHPALQEA
jgi:hypothetical protein